jgi:copper transport protein
MNISRWIKLCALLLLILGLGYSPAKAHGYLVRSIPQDRALLPKAPTRLQIWFSEGLEPAYSTVTVTDSTGKRLDLESGVSLTNRAQLYARLPKNLPNGVYTATLRIAFASDGHLQTDRLVFWVGESRVGDVASGGANQDIYWIEVIARSLINWGMLLTFGTLFLYRFVLFPAWRNPVYRAGGLAPRVMRTISGLTWFGIGLALIGNGVYLFQQATILFNTDLARVLSESLWRTVLNTTQYGQMWTWRVIFIGITAGFLIMADRIPDSQPTGVSLLWTMASLSSAVALAFMSWISHAPGATLWAVPAIFVDWLHLIASGVWVGGLIALVWVLRTALQPLESSGRRLALIAVLRRFSPLAVVSVALIAATGAFAAALYFYEASNVIGTVYGRNWVAKMALVAPLLGLGYIHHRALHPDRFAQAEPGLLRTLRLEALIGIGVFMAAALLTATPPPEPPYARSEATVQSYAAVYQDYSLTLALSPGGVGVNSYEVKFTRNGQPVSGASLRGQWVLPEYDKRSDWIAFDPLTDGEYSATGAEITRTGTWWGLFNVTLPDQSDPLRFAVSLRDLTATVTETGGATRQPTPLHWLTVLGLMSVFIGMVWSPVRGWVHVRHWDRQSLIVGAGVTLLTGIVLIAGTVITGATLNAFEASSNPRPRVSNPVLPDAGSLLIGERLAVTCDPARQQTRTPPTRYVTDRKEAELVDSVARACPALTELDRWHVVNWLRFRYDR